MRVLLMKRADGSSVLKCIRADGSETWQKQQGAHAAFFPLHDLTHFAVETELAIRHAFFGVLADGWTIEETGQRGVAARLPPDALFVEQVVGTLDVERASGMRWTADEFNDALERKARADGRPAPRRLTDDDLARVRKRRAELFEQWHALAPGGTLELIFRA